MKTLSDVETGSVSRETFRNGFAVRIGLAFCLFGVLLAAGIAVATGLESRSALTELEEDHARFILDSTLQTISSAHSGLESHHQLGLRMRKVRLQDIISTAFATLNSYFELHRAGKMTEAEAKDRALSTLSEMRYDRGIGYVWVNDMGTPYPRMVMHPTMPELNGAVLDDPKFNCALGTNENLFVAFVRVCQAAQQGYVDYLWEKPTPRGLTNPVPKLSFVRLFKPWNWVVGSGLYIDDIEADTTARREAILGELRHLFRRTRLTPNGYMFAFDGKKKMLIHPAQEKRSLELPNPATGDLADELMAAAHSSGSLTYLWDKPSAQGKHWKKAHIRYFEPFDWYIGVSFYQDDIEAKAFELTKTIVVVTAGLLLVAVFLSFLLARSLARPLRQLAYSASHIDLVDDPQGAEVPVVGTQETRHLGRVINRMLETISAHMEAGRQHAVAIESSRKLLANIVDNATVTVVLKDRHGHYLLSNRSFQDLVGKDEGAILGWTDNELFEDEVAREIRAHDGEVIEADEAREFEEQIQVAGDQRIFSTTRFPVRDRSGAITALGAIGNDVTESRQLEGQLRQSDKMQAIGQLAGGVAHDFNNVLCGIIGSAEALRSEIDTNDKNSHWVDLILQSSERAADLTRRLLTFSRQGTFTFDPVDVNTIAREASEILKHTISKLITVRLDLEKEPLVVRGDATELANAIINLGVNARDAMQSGGRLTISTACMTFDEENCRLQDGELLPGAYVEISVSDTGSGIPKSVREQIFEPFFTTKAIGQGTGLGLSAVRGCVQQHGGTIQVYSEDDRGTMFKIYLPLLEGDTAPLNEQASEDLSGRGRILLADDESVLRDATRHLLSEFGYDVEIARDGSEATSLYSDRFDLVILDLVMPIMDGYDAFTAIRRIDPSAKILIASGFNPHGDAIDLMKQGAQGFIRKPYRREALALAVKRALEDEEL